jgi:hypothetical protein
MLEGVGARVKRLFPLQPADYYDPFVLLDEFFVEPGAGFPEHPHRGFDAVTYIKRGAFRHRDNLGNDSVVGPGGVLRFTAGRGIAHSEMPQGDELAHGFQLWINLPRRLKGMEPAYQATQSERIPVFSDKGVVVRTIIGEKSPVWVNTEVQYRDIGLQQGSEYELAMPRGWNGMLYVYEGSMEVDDAEVEAGHGVGMEEPVLIRGTGPGRNSGILLAGAPHHEPIFLNGSFVD